MKLTRVDLGGRPDGPVLVVGPSLGTSVETLWRPVADRLAPHVRVIGWDLPGHGSNTHPVTAAGPTTMADLAAGVLELLDDVPLFHYAGDSAGGAVGLQLLLDAPERVASATLLCTGARIGSAEGWRDRIATVREGGVAAVVEGSAQRWVAPGFAEREPRLMGALLDELRAVDVDGYAAVCEALVSFDVRDRLSSISTPLVAVAGRHDVATPPEDLRLIASSVGAGRLVELDDVAHLAPAEAPDTVATLVHALIVSSTRAGASLTDVRAQGLAVRREVLGDAHVDRAVARTTDLTRDFQDLITEFAWGSIWTRPGLDRRSRSMITLTALIARGHHEELAMHLRAARTNGLSDAEISEVLLQSAIYCGVPDANTAFRIAQQVLAEEAEG